MTYGNEWRALSARIQALAQASDTHACHMAVNRSDPYARARRLIEQSRSLLDAVKSFSEQYKRLLPEPTSAAVGRLLEQTLPLVSDATATAATREEQASTAILQLSLFDSEISFLLTDVRAMIRSHCERAFEHLRRLIVVDPAQKALWQAGYRDGEVACEKLGATHLLGHGIWAFKADSVGARTDLVYSEPINFDSATRAADGLVLTEWKKTPKEKVSAQEASRLFAGARLQAQAYTEGPLAGFELTDYRYIILVSWQDAEMPADVLEGGVVYRHVNIPVAPLLPSKRRSRT
jgi:hypothetical protein